MADATFTQVSDADTTGSTLIEGLPGHGLVAAIAVDQITTQLGLKHYGTINAEAFPPVTTFQDGLVHDLVRVYAGADPAVLTLQSDLALPQNAIEPLSGCVVSELAERFDEAIFIAGAPAQSEDDLGTVQGIGTVPTVRDELEAAGVTVPDEHGLVGGITGGLVRECYREEIPAALLIVQSYPHIPDPRAAKAVIDKALSPLVEFEVDTTELAEQADEIQSRLQQIAAQHQRMQQEQQEQQTQSTIPGMFQ